MFTSRLEDAGGWCRIISSPGSINDIIRGKYSYEKKDMIYAGSVEKQLGDVELDGIDITTIHQNDRRKSLVNAKLGITGCAGLIAETGTAGLITSVSEPRELSLLPETHIVIAYSDQLFATLDEFLAKVTAEYGDAQLPSITLVTGPSRTADIEKKLVVGVHGPVEFGVVVIDRSE